MHNFISFDVGGTSVKYGILTNEGTILLQDTFISQRDNVSALLDEIVAIINKYKEEYNLQGIAFSLPGIIDVESGLIPFMGAIQLEEPINIKEYFQTAVGLPVEIENDANCAVLAELWTGAGTAYDDFVCFTIGTGIGGAIVINRQLYRGYRYTAGEFGMMYHGQNLDTPFSQNSWGGQGSTQRLVKRLIEITKNTNLNGKYIFEQADLQNEPYYTEVEKFYQANAIGVYNLWIALNPQKIIIGGGVSARGDQLVNKIKKYVDDLMTIDVLQMPNDVMTTCQHANDAGIIGALYHFLQRQPQFTK